MSQQLHLRNVKEAAWKIERILADLNIETVKHPIHKNSNGMHIRLKNVRTGKIYHIKYATEPFKSFGQVFRVYARLVGETIDQDAISDLADTDELYFCYPGGIYHISVGEYRMRAMSRPNDADGGTITLSVPMNILERFL